MIFRQLELIFRDGGRLGCAIGPFPNEKVAEDWEEDVGLIFSGLRNGKLSDVVITIPKSGIPKNSRLPSEPSHLIKTLIDDYCDPERN